MELSGLIFVALALVWAIVLIPMALKHHDEVAKTRAVDKFSDDMRVLARREAVSDREARLVYGRPAAPAASAPRAPGQPAPEQPARPSVEHEATAGRAAARNERRVEATPRTKQARRRAAAAAARRRRRILAVLLLADVVVGAGVPLGWFLTWAPAIPVGLLGDVEPSTEAGALWDPVPVTLPSYVT